MNQKYIYLDIDSHDFISELQVKYRILWSDAKTTNLPKLEIN